MSVIRVVWGTGKGPTELAAYDRALAAAGIHDYNLVRLSSVIPSGPEIEVVGTAPDLGPVGNELRVVESSATATPGESIAASIGWARSRSGKGIFYEVAGTDADEVRTEVTRGIESGKDLRDWEFTDEQIVVESIDGTETYASVVVCATFGESEPLL